MKILIVTATYPPSSNGVAISTKRMVDALRLAGHEVSIVGPEHKQMTESQYYTFQTAHNVPGIPSDYPLVLPWIVEKTRKEIEKTKWDIVHVHNPGHVSLMALKIGERCGAPVVFTYHSQYDSVLKRNVPFFPDWVYELIYYIGAESIIGKMAAIVATTTWLARELEQKFPKIPVYYVSTAGLSASFALPTTQQKLRKQLSLPSRDPLFIVVTRLSPEKNVSFILKSFAKWISIYRSGTLLLIGDGNDRKNLELLAGKLRIKNRVKFLGNLPNASLAPWLNAADIFLYSSTTDTVSVNLVEAMSAGLPVVAIDDKTTREIIFHGVNGFLSPPQTSVFVTYMKEALQNRSVLSRAAKDAIQDYTIDKTSTSLIHTYEQIIKRYRSQLH